MNTTPDKIEIQLNLLAETPPRIASIRQGIENTQLQFRPDAETWSANDILAHLRSCADVWGKSIIAMIAQDHPTIRYISPRTWIRKTNYPELEFRPSLEAFARQRNELLKSLITLEIEDWSRGATFTATTRGREHTILSYVQRIIQHENEHCEQLDTMLKPE
jgi:hypothetical protein